MFNKIQKAETQQLINQLSERKQRFNDTNNPQYSDASNYVDQQLEILISLINHLNNYILFNDPKHEAILKNILEQTKSCGNPAKGRELTYETSLEYISNLEYINNVVRKLIFNDKAYIKQNFASLPEIKTREDIINKINLVVKILAISLLISSLFAISSNFYIILFLGLAATAFSMTVQNNAESLGKRYFLNPLLVDPLKTTEKMIGQLNYQHTYSEMFFKPASLNENLDTSSVELNKER